MRQSVTECHAFIVLYPIYIGKGNKTQGAIRVCGVPLPDFSNSNEL